MSNEDLLLSPTGNTNFIAKQSDSASAVRKGENKSDIKEIKNLNEDGERTGKKRDSLIRKKNMERLNRIHLRRSGGNSDKSPVKAPKQELGQTRCSTSANQSQEEIVNASKPKNAKKNPEEVVSTSRFKRKAKDVEKPPDSKTNPPAEKVKKSGSKIKAVTAFGTTFHKIESDTPPLPKKRPSSSTDRFRKSKRSKSKDAITEEAGDEPTNDSSQSQLRPSTRHSSLKMSLSKNKLTEMLEDKDLDKGKIKGAFETATGKRARSPYHASSKVEEKKQSSKVRMEGDPRHMNGKQEEKSEIGKDLSFFEKIQQNVRAYFSPKSSEITKFEEEEKKKVQEGEHPETDANIMIWKDGRIERGFKEDFMRGDQNFFICAQKEKKSGLDKGCKDITNEYFPGQKSARGNGSGPGGKIAYSYGDICNPSIDNQFRRLYYIKRRNCTEKQRTGSFHRSKTFQKNGLAPSAPKSSSSISLVLEPDEQVENISSANGMASAFVQVQELHQEISPSVVQRRVNYVRGTRNVDTREDNLTPTMGYAPGEMTAEWMQGCRKSGCRTCRLRLIGSRRKRTAAVAEPKSTTCIRGYGSRIESRTKSEGSIQTCPFIHSVVLLKDLPGRIPSSNGKNKPPPKQDATFLPIHTQWFVYSVTDAKSFQTTRQELPSMESSARNTGQSGMKSGRKKAETVPRKKPEAEKKVQDEPASVTLKDIINLLRTIFHQSSGKVPGHRNSGPRSGKGTDDHFAMSHCLAKLMQEKKNYLNLEDTKKLRKAHKASFISDSFNFFNLLNKEFLSLKTSDPRIEELRNVIAQKKEPGMEEYLDMYKRVIRMSLTEPEQCLMDKAKKELERYTDMYYDLMKCICLEKEGTGGTSFSRDKSSEKRREKVNYEEMLKSNIMKSVQPLDNYSGKAKTRTERSHPTKARESRQDRDSDIGRCRATNTFKNNSGSSSELAKDHGMNDSKTKPVVELLSPLKHESQQDSEGRKSPEGGREDPSSVGKIFLALSLCEDGLLIKHADGSKGFPGGENEDRTSQLPEGDTHESFEDFPKSSQIKKSQSGCVRADSDMTIYNKSSIYENDSSEDHAEQSMLKLKAFRKILREGLQHFALFDEVEGEDEHRQRIKRELGDKSLHKDIKTLRNGGKRDSNSSKSSRKQKFGADSLIYATREERTKQQRSYKRRSNSFSRSASTSEKEDTTKKVPWWRKDNFSPTTSGASKVRKSSQPRKTENYRSVKRVLPKTTKEADPREDKKKRETEMKEKAEEEPPKSSPEFVTPPESFSERRFEIKDLEGLLRDISSKMPNLDALSGGKVVDPEEEEERELRKLNLSDRDENGADILEKQEPLVCTGHKTTLRLGFNNPLKAEWMEESSLMDYQKVAEVLNQFLGSVAEVWKAAACLKDLIQPQTSKAEDPQPPRTPEPEEDPRDHVQNNRGTIESFKNFLRVLTAIFEDDPREEVIRKQLSLLKKEFVEHSQDPLAPECEASERTRFVQEVAAIPREVRGMIAKELFSDEGERENMELASFLAAVKKIVEKLKDSYFRDEGESPNDGGKSECRQPNKIYYRPSKEPSQKEQDEPAMKSNLGNLAEKIRKLCKEKNTRSNTTKECSLKNNASLDTRSSVYFDAADEVLHPSDTPRSIDVSDADNIDKVALSPIDESYFSLNSSNFEKYRSLIYDNIITFLRSDDQRNVNYGIALLGRMIDRDGSSSVKIERKASGAKEERERKWQDLLDKLMETCQVIETEMRKEVEKCAGVGLESDQRKMEVGRTCEYLRGYVDRMKSLIKELKSPDDAVRHVKALENSRETNKERQLVSSDPKLPARQKYLLDNAMDFINSIGSIGYSFDKFPFFPKCFGRNGSEKKTCPAIDAFRNEVSNELLLEGNKTMVKSLRRNIDKRQRKIQGMIEEAGKGVTQAESFLGEKITRKVRDLKKYYLLLEKMICDPTMLPPKWLKLEGSQGQSGKCGKPTKKGEPSVMTMLEDLMKQVSTERKTLKCSGSTTLADSRNNGFPSPSSAGSLALVKIKYESVNVECPAQSRESDAITDVEEQVENGVPLRPITA